MSYLNVRWLVTGANGQLGQQLVERLKLLGCSVDALDHARLDISDANAVERTLGDLDPSYVVNAAAFTDVEKAESSPGLAHRINALGAANLASSISRRPGACFVHISTDYVFGEEAAARRPWAEDDSVNPINAYGSSKAQGEREVQSFLPDKSVIVRTAWLYSSAHANFVSTMVSRALRGEPSRVVNDQWGQPTWARDAADMIIELAANVREEKAPPGIYHATNSGRATWFEFARQIYAGAGADRDLVAPMASSELSGGARRPSWSVLGHEAWTAAGLTPPRSWESALAEALPKFVRMQRTKS